MPKTYPERRLTEPRLLIVPFSRVLQAEPFVDFAAAMTGAAATTRLTRASVLRALVSTGASAGSLSPTSSAARARAKTVAVPASSRAPRSRSSITRP